MISNPCRLLAAIALCASLSACGSEPPAVALAQGVDGPPPPPSPGYQLTDAEKKLDCKKLTGTMQVRILQIRDHTKDRDGTVAARGAQVAATAIFGGTKQGVDPGGQLASDIMKLEAYNQQLAAKKCKTFNLQEDLRPGATETPRPR